MQRHDQNNLRKVPPLHKCNKLVWCTRWDCTIIAVSNMEQGGAGWQGALWYFIDLLQTLVEVLIHKDGGLCWGYSPLHTQLCNYIAAKSWKQNFVPKIRYHNGKMKQWILVKWNDGISTQKWRNKILGLADIKRTKNIISSWTIILSHNLV